MLEKKIFNKRKNNYTENIFSLYIYSLIFSRLFANLKKNNNLIIFQQHISIKKEVI